MTREQLLAEIVKLRQGIRAHRDSSGHELCWHHPALWGLLPEKTDPLPRVPEWPVFLQGCVKYRQSLDEQASQVPRSQAHLAEPTDDEIVSRRDFAAPRERVFEAFSNPHHLIHWWGPKGFTNTFHEFDLRPGGAWRFVMHAPDGTDYPNAKDFVEVVAPERIVFEHLDPQHRFRMTMTLAENSRGTTLTWRMRFESATDHAQLKDIIAAANEENFDRLAAYLAKLSTPKAQIDRRFEPQK